MLLRLGKQLHVSAFRTFVAGMSSSNNTDLIYGACFVKYSTRVIVSGMKSFLLAVKQNNMSQTHAAPEGCSAMESLP